MTTIEKIADAIGQIIFRLETNLQTLKGRTTLAVAPELWDGITADLENLKKWKADLLAGDKMAESDRQLMLMALAHLAVERPGWDNALSRIAVTMDNVVDGKAKLYENFKDLHTDQLHLGTQPDRKSST